MYTTCLFCHGDLGRNEVVEAFPVGRRLAFDAARGRLWVVCRACERWNLTPLEERWEAVDACERLYRNVRTRISTDNIGLARLREGLELVRIGQPLKPEMAAWRYGDQFGRRRVRAGMAMAGSAVSTGALLFATPMLAAAGMVIGGAMAVAWVAAFLGAQERLGAWSSERLDTRPRLRVALGSGQELGIAPADYGLVQLLPDGDGARLVVVSATRTRWVLDDRLTSERRETHVLVGEDIMRVAGALLPRVNQLAGGGRRVQQAVRALEEAPSIDGLVRQAAVEGARRYEANPLLQLREPGALATLPPTLRLAMEMAAHEEQERRALEGELAELERAWQAAEEVAAIADGMLVPDAVSRGLVRLRGQSGDTRGGPAA